MRLYWDFLAAEEFEREAPAGSEKVRGKMRYWSLWNLRSSDPVSPQSAPFNIPLDISKCDYKHTG
jgi:hypothetical protein